MPNARPAEQLWQAAVEFQTIFDPPDFNALRHIPTLQSLCRHHWLPFHNRWSPVGGEKARAIVKLQAQLHRIELDRLVPACLTDTGRSIARPFHLSVEFVHWPETYQRQVSNDRVILGVQYVEVEHAAALHTILHAMIVRLI